MKIAKNKVATIEYTLTGDDGAVIDTSEGRHPLDYIHGIGGLVPGLEAELEGKEAGAKLAVTIPAEEGYGPHIEHLVAVVPKNNFDEPEKIDVGVRFHTTNEQGQTHVVTVTKVGDDDVTIDGNHPLAGKTLHFAVEVVGVRDVTDSELEAGHIHGPGCNHD